MKNGRILSRQRPTTALGWAEGEPQGVGSSFVRSAAAGLSWAEETPKQASLDGEEARIVGSEQKTGLKTKPSYPNLTDEHVPTDAPLWEKCLEVVNGERREFTRGDRTIHSPNNGRGYLHMPNPKGIAWAVKQYKGFGGNWKGRKEAAVLHPSLRVMALGGVAVAGKGELDGLQAQGLIKLAGQTETHAYWDITAAGLRVFRAGLKEELVHKVDDLQGRVKAYPADAPLSREDRTKVQELAAWFRKTFRVDSAKTPKGQKKLKEEAHRFLKTLEEYSRYESPKATLFDFDGPWGWGWSRHLQPALDDLVRYFTGEGDSAAGKKEQIVELKLTHAVYVSRASISEVNFRKYAEKIDAVFGRVKGWRAKALKGSLTVVFQGAGQMKSQGKYITAKDEMWVKATPAVMKRGEGSYGSADYILVHELGHRFEKFNRLPEDFDRSGWHTTSYSRTEGFGGSESFAELFALGHFDIKGNWDGAIVDRFEKLMTGKAEV